MDDLIARLEKAPGPDRELDNAIEAAIDLPKPTNSDDLPGWPPYFTGSIDAALTLVPESFKWRCGYSRLIPHNAELIDYGGHQGSFIGECDSNRAIALCIAALKARATVVKGNC